MISFLGHHNVLLLYLNQIYKKPIDQVAPNGQQLIVKHWPILEKAYFQTCSLGCTKCMNTAAKLPRWHFSQASSVPIVKTEEITTTVQHPSSDGDVTGKPHAEWLQPNWSCSAHLKHNPLRTKSEPSQSPCTQCKLKEGIHGLSNLQ